MKIGLQIEKSKFEAVPGYVKEIPDFWLRDEYYYVFHNNYFTLPSWNEKLRVREVLNGEYKPLLKYFLDNYPKDKKIILFNEIFKSDAGLFSTALRENLTVDKIKEILKFTRENTECEISITEHRLGSLFLARQGWLKHILEECKEFINSVGIQVWIQPSSPLYNLQKEIAFKLIEDFQEMGFDVFISESAVFEKHQEYQAETLDKLLKRAKKTGVKSYCYWYLRDNKNRTQPNRDCSLGPGLFTEDWQPKPILDVFKSYAQSF